MTSYQFLGRQQALRDLGLLKLGSLPGGMSPAAFKAMVRSGETVASRAAASATPNFFRPVGRGAVPTVQRAAASPFQQGIGSRIVPGFEQGAAPVQQAIAGLGGKVAPQAAAAAQGAAAPASGLKARLQAALPAGGASAAAPALPATPPNAFKARLQAALPR